MARTILQPRRRTLGALAPDVRRLHFECGSSAEAIAELLAVDARAVAEYVGLLSPRQAHPRRRGESLNRPRSRREQAALSEWAWAGDDDDGAPLLMVPGPSPAIEVVPPAEPVEWDGPISPKGGKDDGPYRPRRRRTQRVPKPGDRRVKLTPEKRDEIRRLAREGWGTGRLAKRFKVDRKTVRELLRGEGHAGDYAEPIPPLAPPLVPIGLRPEAEPPPIPAPASDPRRIPKAGDRRVKLSPEDRREIRRLAGEGWGCRRLSRRFGVEETTIRRLLHGETFSYDDGAPPRPPKREGRTKGHRWKDDRSDPLHRDPGPDDVVELVRTEAPPRRPFRPAEPTLWEGGPLEPGWGFDD